MAKTNALQSDEVKELRQALYRLEERITRLERHVGLEESEGMGEKTEPEAAATYPAVEPAAVEGPASEEGLEFRVGEFGLAWLGNLVFLLGIIFLMTVGFNAGRNLAASLVGYASSIALYFLSKFLRRTFPYVAYVMVVSAFILLFYTTMRMHFYSENPLIGNEFVVPALLLLVAGVDFHFALQRYQSQFLAGLGGIFWLTAALLINTPHITFPLVAIGCAGAVYLRMTRKWWSLHLATVFLAYLTHLLWLMNNPILGNSIQAISEHQYNFIYPFLYAAILSWPSLRQIQKEDTIDNLPSYAIIFFNSLGFFSIGALIALTFEDVGFATLYLAMGTFFIILAIIQWERTKLQIAPSVNACFGFLALTIAIFSYTKIPAAFFWLTWQSLLVVTMALWFRSKIIVVVNSLIFIAIVVAYLANAKAISSINFSVAIVALTSARIMNWKKERLTLRTEMLRNVYLVVAFFFVLYALHHALPPQYVTLSWTGAAVGYLLLSLLLKNIKYRYMAIFTMLFAVLFLFFVDLARLEAVYRIVAFLILGFISVAISLFYTKYKHLLKKGEE